ncbi:LacI family DNA-binding transcriptional regulator [Poseidonocella sp. HB161398]|uniref:LacI family DNA-binding transcriptional regulator n=1 Tax=Poseidonocella sp. HB161398 TaxID=2320855 RepID=UPI00110A05C2|nr:LacI family DNA-binding transcriptional regulator [Poseidonocella sp. HB161398]
MPRHTIADLARESGLSVSTVERILSGRGGVKRATVEHVLQIAEQMDFYATGSIRRHLGRTAARRKFGLLVPAFDRLFYDDLCDAFMREAAALRRVAGEAVLARAPGLEPAEVAAALRKLGAECDAVACVAVDHPLVNRAIADLAGAGVPVLPLLSEVSAGAAAGFVGASDWQIGRSAGWFLDRLPARPLERIAVISGHRLFRCQQTAEAGFRAYAQAEMPGTEILPTRFTGEEDQRAAEIARQLMAMEQPPGGIFLCGGGVDGLLAGLGSCAGPRPVTVALEATQRARLALADGGLDVVLAHPAAEAVPVAVARLEALLNGAASASAPAETLPFRILLKENA